MLMGKNVKGARALRQERPSKISSVLSESEEEVPEGGLPSSTTGDPMTDAVSKLTEIMSHLTQTNQRKGSSPSFTVRSWIEHRSHIGSWKSIAHSAWGVGGILDSLRSGNVPAARARCCLLLLQLDQCAVDKGQWRLAAELSLEAPPPFATLGQHQSPNVLDGEMPYSRLLDTRWSDLAIAHIRETDDYLLKRGQLGRKSNQPADSEDSPDATPKRRPKAKAKAKASDEA